MGEVKMGVQLRLVDLISGPVQPFPVTFGPELKLIAHLLNKNHFKASSEQNLTWRQHKQWR
jgi:hypothetical protein